MLLVWNVFKMLIMFNFFLPKIPTLRLVKIVFFEFLYLGNVELVSLRN